jgi:peptidyl-prolyl cis-trans isomerase A (cyclophilin A)
MVIMETRQGNIEIELLHDKAPISAQNFLDYVDAGFYDGTIIHRVVPGFVVQGGGFTAEMKEKETNPPIANEADNGCKNLRGTLSMARTQEKDSATSQFFINLVDNAVLDHGARDFGYAVFARVVAGMDVVDKLAAAPTGTKGFHQDVPMEPMSIISARRKDKEG